MIKRADPPAKVLLLEGEISVDEFEKFITKSVHRMHVQNDVSIMKLNHQGLTNIFHLKRLTFTPFKQRNEIIPLAEVAR